MCLAVCHVEDARLKLSNYVVLNLAMEMYMCILWAIFSCVVVGLLVINLIECAGIGLSCRWVVYKVDLCGCGVRRSGSRSGRKIRIGQARVEIWTKLHAQRLCSIVFE